MRTFTKIAFAILLTCAVVWGQSISTSQIQGTVQDSSGSAVPGAEVKATQTETGATRTVTTGADGSYLVTNLPVGPYQIEVTKQGFTKYVQAGVILQVASNPTIDVALKVGAVTEEVLVQADATMVETHSTGVGQVVDQQRVVDLPLNGRDPASLIYLAGAATVAPTGDLVTSGKNYPGIQTISVGGGEAEGMSFLVDGASFNDPTNNLTMVLPFPDAIQEFKVETSALPAQYGQHSAAAINVVTKSGTNAIHGDAFEFLRNGDLNARNFFAPTRDSLKRNQFGGTLGGPIEKNKLFFFTGFQGTIQRSTPISSNVIVPTPAMDAGNFSVIESPACNSGVQKTLKAPFVNNQINPAMIVGPTEALLKYMPTPIDQCGDSPFASTNQNENEYQGLGRVDYQMNDKETLFARYFASHFYQPAGDYQQDVLNTAINGVEAFVQSLAVGDTYLFSPTTVNSFHITGNRQSLHRVTTSEFTGATLGVPIYNVPLPFPASVPIAITGGATIFGTGGNFITMPQDTYQFADDLSMVRGSHQLGFGVNVIRSMLNTLTNRLANGMFTFSGQTTGLGYGDLFLGDVGTFQQADPSEFQPRAKYLGVYAQDS